MVTFKIDLLCWWVFIVVPFRLGLVACVRWFVVGFVIVKAVFFCHVCGVSLGILLMVI